MGWVSGIKHDMTIERISLGSFKSRGATSTGLDILLGEDKLEKSLSSIFEGMRDNPFTAGR